jgi:hypothetical protein
MKAADEGMVEESLEDPLYGDEIRIYGEIARSIRGEKAFPVTPAHALELSRILDAIRTSSEENHIVTL